MPSETPAQVALLAAGDSVYVFHPGDERIDMQRTVLIGANLDVDGPRLVDAQTWVFQVRGALAERGVQVVDCRDGDAGTEPPNT